MTPREKAKELVDKYQTIVTSLDYNEIIGTDNSVTGQTVAKQCTLLAVEEIIKECYNWNGSDNVQWETKRFDYWQEVKQEIEKL